MVAEPKTSERRRVGPRDHAQRLGAVRRALQGFGIYNTEYRTVSDTTNKIYYFELTTSPSVIWTDLKALDFRPGAPVRILNPDSIDLSGDVTGSYRRAPAPF